MDRVLTQEFPPAIFQSSPTGYSDILDNGWVPINSINTILKHESTIDLGGYTRQDDLTVFFRSSFEQIGGPYTVTWRATTQNPLSGFNAVVTEQLIVSSIPFTDIQLELMMAYSPGFTAYTATGLLDFKTGNRNTTIHGHRIDHAISTTTGATSFDADGEAYLVPLLDDYYSSLDATAADTLYCYRLVGLNLGTQTTGLKLATIPPRRIILDTTVDKESELSYMMRLKRSYELANQV
jgi:hypothetical protein